MTHTPNNQTTKQINFDMKDINSIDTAKLSNQANSKKAAEIN